MARELVAQASHLTSAVTVLRLLCAIPLVTKRKGVETSLQCHV